MHLIKARELVTAAVDNENVPKFIFMNTLSATLGFGCGPIFGSLCVPMVRTSFHVMRLGLQDLNPGAYANIALLTMHIVVTPLAIAMLPLRLHKAGVDTVDPSAEKYLAAPERARRINVVLALMCVLWKDSVASSIETFDVLLLEVEYGWDVSSSGFFAGSAMLIAAIPMMMYGQIETKIPESVNIWIHRCSFLAFVLCSFAAFESLCPFSTDSSCVLFMWVFRVFNYMFWGIAMAFLEGGLFRWATQDETRWNSFGNFSFCYSFLVEGITRSLGPFMVRSFYEHGGRFSACLFLTASETFVLIVVFVGLIAHFGKYWN